MGFIVYLSVIIAISSCVSVSKNKLKIDLKRFQKKYEFQDKSGKFLVNRKANYIKDKNLFFVKKDIYQKGNNKLVEQSITVSVPLLYKKKYPILRPYSSKFTVWLNKEKHSTTMKVDKIKRTIMVKMDSPENKFNGTKEVPFPYTSGAYCFFSQLIECVAATGFTRLAIKKRVGTMNFYIIWDGYPYIHQQYINIPNEVFSSASISYDGIVKKDKSARFSLTFSGQVIFYFVNSKMQLTKLFWTSQGVSMKSAI